MATAKQSPASHALKPTASLMDPFGSISLEEPIAVSGAGPDAEAPAAGQLVEVDAGSMAQVWEPLHLQRMTSSCRVHVLGLSRARHLPKLDVKWTPSEFSALFVVPCLSRPAPYAHLLNKHCGRQTLNHWCAPAYELG